MNTAALWRFLFILIVIIIIIGGVIIIIIRGPIPEPICIACITKRIVPLGIVEIVAGLAALGVLNKIKSNTKIN